MTDEQPATKPEEDDSSSPTVKRTQYMSRHSSTLMFDDSKAQKTTSELEGNNTSNTANQCQRFLDRTVEFYWENEFVLLTVVAILLARAYPPLGAVYLAPQITSDWIAVIFIFIMAGLGLKTDELCKAFQRLWFNITVQIFNFGVVSAAVFGVSRGLAKVNPGFQALADGMVVCASLPLTINMVVVLTKSAGGDEASAIFNAAFGNLLGVFLSPVLIWGYLGVSSEVELWEVFYKLSLRVGVPVAVGQVLQYFSPPVVAFTKKYKVHFKQAQQYILVYIVYTVFCETFLEKENSGNETNVGDIFIMIAVQFVLLCGLMLLSWYTFRFLFKDEPALRVMGLFGSTQKTVAMGIPMINAIYDGNPLVGLYTLPLLIWHPMQLVVGTFLVPKLATWVEKEQQRLGLVVDDAVGGDDGDEETRPDTATTYTQREVVGSGSLDEEAPPEVETTNGVETTASTAQ